MKIKALIVENFRSIKYLELAPANLCALIGPNSSGKTNVMKAIDLVIGEGWTTKARVARALFNDPDKPIKISIEFELPIKYKNSRGSDVEIFTIELQLKLRPELYAKTTVNDGNIFYDQEQFKRLCHFIFIPSDRQLGDELRVNQWTMLGKIMRAIYESYVLSYGGDEDQLKEDFRREIIPAKSFLEKDFAVEGRDFTFKKFANTFKKYCQTNSAGLASEFEPVLDIYNLNWFYKTLQIHIKEDFSDSHFDSEEVGSGMQNLLVLSIFQTYAELMGDKVILGIEEPEIYLYPQAQRTLYKNFIDISKTSQIFYTTHNPNFVDAIRPDDINLLRKSKGFGTYKLKKNPNYFNSHIAEKERHRIYTQFNTNRNELFFSKKVLFVEGDSDKILFSILCKDKWNIDLDEKGYTVISCGGKGGVNYFIGVCNIIGFDEYFAVWDKDNDGDYSPKKNFLPETLKFGKGVEIEGNLEKFLGINGDHKVKNAYEWAKSIDKEHVPVEFENVKSFFLLTKLEKIVQPIVDEMAV